MMPAPGGWRIPPDRAVRRAVPAPACRSSCPPPGECWRRCRSGSPGWLPATDAPRGSGAMRGIHAPGARTARKHRPSAVGRQQWKSGSVSCRRERDGWRARSGPGIDGLLYQLQEWYQIRMRKNIMFLHIPSRPRAVPLGTDLPPSAHARGTEMNRPWCPPPANPHRLRRRVRCHRNGRGSR